MDDLREHIGTVIVIIGGMWAILIMFAGIIWKGVKADLAKFPIWLIDVNKRGGVVTHDELLEDGPLMTTKSHEIICARVVSQIVAQVAASERHQKDLIDLVEREFKAAFAGQDAIIKRISNFQEIVLKKIASMKQNDDG